MGKFYLLLVSAAIVFGGTSVSQGIQRSAIASYGRLGEHSQSVLAREIALSGHNEAAHAVAKEWKATGTYTGPTTFSGSFQNGTYSATVTQEASQFLLKAVGRYGSRSYVISSRYDAFGGQPEVPKFMSYTYTLDGHLQIRDNFTLQSANPMVNASIHANGNMQINSGTALVEGFGYASGNIQINNGSTAQDIFRPKVNPDRLPVAQTAPPIPVPSFNAADYLSKVTRVTNGNLTLSGTYALGTKENPVVWYVGGNVTTSGPVAFTGYGIIVTPQHFQIGHNMTTQFTGGESNVGFYSQGKFSSDNGNLTISGQIFANGNVSFRSNTTINGSVTSKGNFQTSGAVTINYYPASVVLTKPIWNESNSKRLALSSVREWQRSDHARSR